MDQENKNKKLGLQEEPILRVGTFIFNFKGELLLIKSPVWKDTYISPGGKLEIGESLEDTAREKAKEKTSLLIKNLKFLGVEEAINICGQCSEPYKHLVFVDYVAEIENSQEVVLNEEAIEYKWLKIEDWLKRKDLSFFTRSSIEKILKLKLNENDKYEEVLEQKESAENMCKRALADYQNLLRQTAEEKKSLVKYANENLLSEFIPVYDNLKMSLAHVNEEAENNGWLTGIKHVIRQFKNILENSGVEEIKTVGEKFDHNTMEAVKGSGEKVIEEIRPGYKLHGKVIIPARVVVE